MRLLALLVLVAACGPARPTDFPLAHLSGHLDTASFPEAPSGVVALSDGGQQVRAEVANGDFSFRVTSVDAWELEVQTPSATYLVALPRKGRFDRAFYADTTPLEVDFGTVRVLPMDTPIAVVGAGAAESCVEGKLADGSVCVVEEPMTDCAAASVGTVATNLVLGYGGLQDLPGASRGERFAVPTLVPPVVVRECTQPPSP